MSRIVAVGACYMDTILSVPHFPAEDEKLRAHSLQKRRGGNCPNMVEVLKQLLEVVGSPMRPVLCAVLPATTSAATQTIRESLGPRVDLSHCIYREEHSEPASSYIIRSGATSSRTIVNYNALPEMTFEEFVAIASDIGDQVAWYHFEVGYPAESNLEAEGTFPDVKISVELEKPGRVGLQDLAGEADLVLYSRNWAQSKGFNDLSDLPRLCNAQMPLTPRASLLVFTWGDQGTFACKPKEAPESRYIRCVQDKLEASSVVDTIGAGDTFLAGLLFALNCGVSEDLALEYGTVLAYKKVQQEGFGGLEKHLKKRLT